MKKIGLDIIPLTISILLVLISYVITMTSNYVFRSEHYIGMGCLILSTVFYFTHRNLYHYMYTLTLIIGLIGFLDFYITKYKVGFAEIGINPIFLGLLIILYAMDKELRNKILPHN